VKRFGASSRSATARTTIRGTTAPTPTGLSSKSCIAWIAAATPASGGARRMPH